MLDRSATEAVCAAKPGPRATPLRNPLEHAHRVIIGQPPEPAGAAETSMWRQINPCNELAVHSPTYGCVPVLAAVTDIFGVDDMITAAKIRAGAAIDLCGRQQDP